MVRVRKAATEKLEQSQECQKGLHDQQAKTWGFREGDKVLVLLLEGTGKLRSKWQRLYKIAQSWVCSF